MSTTRCIFNKNWCIDVVSSSGTAKKFSTLQTLDHSLVGNGEFFDGNEGRDLGVWTLTQTIRNKNVHSISYINLLSKL